MNAPVTQTESTALAIVGRPQFDLSPQTFEQALTFAQYLADSDLVPKDFKGKPANCLIGMQWGIELGMKPLQAIQNIAVINGRPNLWGDAMLALVRSSPLCEYVVEDWLPDGTAFCKAKRRGEPEQVRTFSDADAKLAGLLGKQGPWTTGPKRMKQLRARAFALRDVFTDVLRGMGMAEEAIDAAPLEKHMGPADVVVPPAPECWPSDLFAARLPEWRKAIAEGRASADSVVAKAKTKHPLSPEQEAAIRKKDEPANPPASEVLFTYAQVADRIAKAPDRDALTVAGDLIGSVQDEQQRAELQGLYDKREAELA